MRLRVLAVFTLLCCLPLLIAAQQPAPANKPAGQKKATQKSEKQQPTKEGKAAENPKEKEKKPVTQASENAEKPPDPLSSPTFSGLKFRSIGPAMISGRVVALAVNPNDRAQYYVGAASGNVWRTDNDGISWTPVFDHEGSYSIGSLALDPKDTNVVWVGTGENNSQRSVSYGDGIYRSEDGGKNWKNMGLKHSEHIARIVIDPRDSNVVYVASQGPLWAPGGDRGLFKTKDGGKTWDNILNISENTGVTDVVMDPSNPDVLYAAAYQRRRHVWTMIDGGPESAIYKSTDAGATWTKLKNGLPSVDMGRIGLAVAPTKPNVVYAIVEAADGKGGIFRSTDRGATWERRNPFTQGSMYYATIYVDPVNPDRLYVMDTFIRVSDDGGKTLQHLPEKYKHVDSHVMWIDPRDPDYYLVGCDGGVYESYDRAENWAFKSNLPLSQFYDVAVDNSKPFYYVYGGTQDNNSVGGPSRTMNAHGIADSDWFITTGGDGFHSQVDPEDPNTVYAESQYGGLVRFDRATGQEVGIQPKEAKGEPPLRWNWDSPVLVSSHQHTRIYFAANRVFRSDDRGDHWRAISPDLTRQIDRNKLPIMGKIWGPDAVAKGQSTSFYGNIVAFAESPFDENVLYVGTDDGLIQVTEDGGAHWRKIESVHGVPDRTYVTRLAASSHDAHTVYVSFDNHKNGDFKPYVFKSTDNGKSWTSISSNLPENGPVLAIAEDYVNPKLIFLGTEFGLWFTIDGGQKWVQLKAGLPTIAIRDAVIQKREGDLVLASYGRGFYVLDDISPLRTLTAEELNKEAALITPRNSLLYIPSRPLGGRGKAFMGESYFLAENPPYGAAFTYYLKEKYKSLKEQREEKEKEASKKTNGNPYSVLPYPSRDELRQEAEAEAPSVWLTITDSTGALVRRIPASNSAGFSRTTWDLRYPPSQLPPERAEDNPFNFGPQGRLVMPGQYSVRLSKKVNGQWTDLTGPQTFELYVDGSEKMSAADRSKLGAFQKKIASLDRAESGALDFANELKGKLKQMKRALVDTPADTTQQIAKLDQIDHSLDQLLISLRGDVAIERLNEQVPLSIGDRIDAIFENERLSTAAPTGTDESSYEVAAAEFANVLPQLKKLAQQTTELETEMERLGSPWTPGRIPEWQQQ